MIGSIEISTRHETWPIAGSFAISRGRRTEVTVVVVELRQDGMLGRGECVPYPRYNESVDGVLAQIDDLRGFFEASGGAGPSSVMDCTERRIALQRKIPAGAARNALDCALWDLQCKQQGKSIAALTGLNLPARLTTAYTLSMESPDIMAEAARKAAARPLLKIKVGGEDDEARIAAVRQAAPNSALIVDANEGWRVDEIEAKLAMAAHHQVDLIEQPLPADQDAVLANIDHPVPVCADESCHTRAGLEDLIGRYDYINIKLDKTGGLTEALALAAAARQSGLGLMVGCMLATSLAMAPAYIVAGAAEFVDLDGPLLLAKDRQPGLHFDGSLIHAPEAAFWG